MGDSDLREFEVDLPATAGMGDETSRPTTELGTCLVTGGAGFLGSHLAQELCLGGHRVRVFDRAPVTYSHDHLEVIQGDVTRLDEFTAALDQAREAHRPEVVFFVRRGTRTFFIPVQTDW